MPLKIPSMGSVEVDIDADGRITLRQQSSTGEDDGFVEFPKQLAQLIADEILRLAKETPPKS